MSSRPVLKTHTALSDGMCRLFEKLEQRLRIGRPVKVFLAGGMAVHLYTAKRVTCDVDAEFGARILLPNDLMVEVQLEDGSSQVIYFDTNYQPTLP